MQSFGYGAMRCHVFLKPCGYKIVMTAVVRGGIMFGNLERENFWWACRIVYFCYIIYIAQRLSLCVVWVVGILFMKITISTLPFRQVWSYEVNVNYLWLLSNSRSKLELFISGMTTSSLISDSNLCQSQFTITIRTVTMCCIDLLEYVLVGSLERAKGCSNGRNFV